MTVGHRGLAVLILVALLCLAACRDDGGIVGQEAPGFTLNTVDGGQVHLESLRGKVVLVDFWATWCPPCKALLPELDALKQEFEGRVEVVAVSVDGDPAAAVPPFVASLDYGLVFTADGRGQDVARAWGGTKGIPCTYLVDPGGTVRFHWLGKHDRQDYARAINEVLAEG